ncbi:MAG: CHAT domain-containing protein [Phormidesmis sp.]
MHFTAFRLAAPLLLAMAMPPLTAQAQSAAGEIMLLEQEGALESGDAALPNGNLHDEYTFAGRAGQSVIVTVESEAFNAFLFWVDDNGQPLAENDDWNESRNSTIGYELPENGRYRVWVSVHEQSGQGDYALSVLLTEKDNLVVLESEADRLLQQGTQQSSISQFREAMDSWQEALEIYQAIGDRAGEGQALRNLGFVHRNLGQYQQAADFHWQALVITREISDRVGEGQALGNLGVVYRNLARYQQAIDLHERALVIIREIGDRAGESKTLGNLGVVYRNLGRYQQAIKLYEQVLVITREIGDRAREGKTLGNLGIVYDNLGQYQQAIKLYEQALVITREIGDRAGEGRALGNLGIAYNNLGQYQQAVNLYEQQLVITHEIGDRAGEGRALGNLGIAYNNLGQYQQAINLYEQQLVITREIGDRAGEGRALGNLASLFQTDEKAELAIVFYKQSVNVREAIRQDITDQGFLQSYTDTVSGTSRRLADLLLEQGRILEAQQVLELLKVQELQEYTNDERTGEIIARTIPTPAGCDLDIPLLKVSLLAAECDLITTYTTLVEFGQQFRDCEAAQCENLRDYRRRRDALFDDYRIAVGDLETFIRDRLTTDDALLKPTLFASKAEVIIRQQPGTVIIYPLVLEDKLWLLFAVDGRLTSKREIDVGQLELGQTVVEFRDLLEDRYSDIDELQAKGKQLYDWLIAPIEEELGANQDIQHLVFSLDRTTRYIPMGTLFDGSQYLIEKYTVTTILSAALTNVTDRAPLGTDNVPILGAGVSESSLGFPALPNVPIELDGIIQDVDSTTDEQGVYGGRQLLDEQFTFEALQDALSGTQILHLATHGEFVSGNRDASYLLMGNGVKLPIPDIDKLGTYLQDVHLAVLSACQTALGGPDEEGLEIAGLGYYFLKSQVDAVLASLWNVNDSSTSQLMQLFYQNLATGTAESPITKAEALQAAQLAMIYSNESAKDDAVESVPEDGPDRFRLSPRSGEDAPRPESGLAHPYYWAPFTLIGNGL